RDDARTLVVDEHEQEHEQAAADRALHAEIDGVAPQRGADTLLVRGRNRGRQRARTEHELELARIPKLNLGVRRAERDLGVAAGNPALDHRRARDTPVEDDREAALDVVTGDALEAPAALVRERERLVPTAEPGLRLVRHCGGVADHVARDLGAALQEVCAPPGLLLLERDLVDGAVDRKSTRLNSSHVKSSYAVFCLKKKKPARRPARPA